MEPDRVQVVLEDPVDPPLQGLWRIVLRMEVPAAQPIEAAARERPNKPGRALGRGPRRAVGKAPRHLRLDEPGTDRKDGYATRQLIRQRLAEPANGGLARRVGAVRRAGEVRGAAPGDHDP